MAIRVMVADDHPVVRQGLKFLLAREGFSVVAEASDGREALRQAEEIRPEVAVLDLAMPHLNGLDAAREIMKISPGTKTIILTQHTEEPYILEALRAGVHGYLLKSQAMPEVIQAIRDVHHGKLYLSPAISDVVVGAYREQGGPSRDPLTPREREVLQLVAEGKTTKQVAEMLGITVKTAESHRSRLMLKLGIHEIAGLVRYPVRRPMFPGYLFLRHSMDRDAYIEVRKARGLVTVLGEKWDRLAVVPDGEIESVRALSRSDLPSMPFPYLRKGMRVRIARGPLLGVEGILERRDEEKGLLVLSIALLSRSVAVEVDCTCVVPA